MIINTAVFCLIFISSDAVIYIDNVAVESNPSIANITISYIHDRDGNSITNVTIQTFVVFTKMMLYLKVNIAEDQKASLYKRELVNIAMDVEKLFKGAQGNLIVKLIIDENKKFMDFKIKFPLPPVSQ